MARLATLTLLGFGAAETNAAKTKAEMDRNFAMNIAARLRNSEEGNEKPEDDSDEPFSQTKGLYTQMTPACRRLESGATKIGLTEKES